ncbi:MAG: spore coat protein [Cohnella sp.]|nr:spore coat protein [Cohnella sp.]
MVMNMVQNLTGTDALTDQVIAADFLIAAKTGVKSCAIAITESATPEVRSFLEGQLTQAVALHGDITELMMKRGWYHPYNASEQIKLDIQRAQTAMNLG